jgi:hypothetical protein
VRSNSHAGCGGRAGETHREQPRQGAPVRPDMIGVRADGRKELIALAGGYRESAES